MSSVKYTLQKVTTRTQLDEAIDLAWLSFHNPYRREFQALHPVHGYTASDKARSIEADKQRAWDSHIANGTSSNWYYVTEQSTGLVVGAAQWLVYHETPPALKERIKCTWWPEGEVREFMEEVVNQCYRPRQMWMKDRPFVTWNQMCVHPSFRGQGIGTLLMKPGMQFLEQTGYEGFIEASDPGRLLYEKYGYKPLVKVCIDPARPNSPDEWKRLASEFGDIKFWCMWRPSKGQWTEGLSGPWGTR